MAKDVTSGPAPIIAATEAYERWLHKRRVRPQVKAPANAGFGLRVSARRLLSLGTLWPVWGVLGGLAMWRLAIAMAASPRERRRLDYLPSGDGRWDDRKTTLLLCGC